MIHSIRLLGFQNQVCITVNWTVLGKLYAVGRSKWSPIPIAFATVMISGAQGSRGYGGKFMRRRRSWKRGSEHRCTAATPMKVKACGRGLGRHSARHPRTRGAQRLHVNWRCS